MHKYGYAAAIRLFPERTEVRRIQISSSYIGRHHHACKMQFVERPRHLFEREVHVVEGQMCEALEALRIASARGRNRVIRQPAQFRRMLIDAAVDRRIRENLYVDTRAVDILETRVMVPRGQRRLRPYADESALRALAEFNNVGIIPLQR